MLKKQLKQCRHRKEIPLVVLGGLLTLCVFVILYVLSFYPLDVREYVETSLIESVVESKPQLAQQTREVILANVDGDGGYLLTAMDYLDPVYTIWLFPLYLLGMFLVVLFLVGQQLFGAVRANAVLVSERQFPELYQVYYEMAKELEIEKVPDLYLVNGNGALNAYAACVPGFRNFAAIYSDLYDGCREKNDMQALRFILGHELGHIKFNHVKWWYIAFTMLLNVPGFTWLLGLPLSRAREYGCDKVGHQLSGDQQCRALLMLAAGKHHYHEVDLTTYCEQQRPTEWWSTVSNFFTSHPAIRWRIDAILSQRHGALYFHRKPKKSKHKGEPAPLTTDPS